MYDMPLCSNRMTLRACYTVSMEFIFKPCVFG